jgi:hypothetical protein
VKVIEKILTQTSSLGTRSQWSASALEIDREGWSLSDCLWVTWWRGVQYALVSETLDEAILLVRVMATARVEITASRIA